jgi:hypothetical protein
MCAKFTKTYPIKIWMFLQIFALDQVFELLDCGNFRLVTFCGEQKDRQFGFKCSVQQLKSHIKIIEN